MHEHVAPSEGVIGHQVAGAGIEGDDATITLVAGHRSFGAEYAGTIAFSADSTVKVARPIAGKARPSGNCELT